MAAIVVLISEQVKFYFPFYRYVSCVGQNKQHCLQNSQTGAVPSFLGGSLSPESASVALTVEFVLLICLSLIILYLLWHQRMHKRASVADEGNTLDSAL